MQAPTRMSIDAVRAPVYYVDNTPSTLDVAASLLADTTIPTPHLTTIIADRQSAGRGRLGRSWVTPPGQALLASTIVSLPVSLPADALGWIVHACALSVREALATRLEPLGHAVSLKWPNDVLVDGARPGLVPLHDRGDPRLRRQHRPGARHPAHRAGHLPSGGRRPARRRGPHGRRP